MLPAPSHLTLHPLPATSLLSSLHFHLNAFFSYIASHFITELSSHMIRFNSFDSWIFLQFHSVRFTQHNGTISEDQSSAHI